VTADQGNTPAAGRRDVAAQDAARLAGEGNVWLADDEQLTVELDRRWVADWLRSAEAAAEMRRHHLTEKAGLCGCGQQYLSHVEHILGELARAVVAGG
jgi:hypothetical protein